MNKKRTKTILSWSGGKDSAMTLHRLQARPDIDLIGLLTTVTRDYDRISMHGVRRTLLERQAESIDLPLTEVVITKNATNAEYEREMGAALRRLTADGLEAVAFGDIFLEDLRVYRETKLKELGLAGVFPLWKEDTAELAERFIADGFRAVLACVDLKKLPIGFAGRLYDRSLLADLPSGADPCGERGEFHTFVYDGPVFRKEIQWAAGERVERETFGFQDLLPLPSRAQPAEIPL